MSVNNSFYSVLNVGLMGFLNENIDGATLESVIIQYNLSLAYDEHVNEENLMSLNSSQISSLFTELFNYIPHYFAYKEISTLRDSSIKSIFQKISFLEELFVHTILLKNSWDHDHSMYMEFISDIIFEISNLDPTIKFNDLQFFLSLSDQKITDIVDICYPILFANSFLPSKYPFLFQNIPFEYFSFDSSESLTRSLIFYKNPLS